MSSHLRFDRIVVPTDFSPHSEEALRLAIDFALRFEAHLTIVHAYQPAEFLTAESAMVYDTTHLDEVAGELSRMLRLQRAVAEERGVRHVSTILREGVAADSIANYARDVEADLIIMGTHGRSGIARAVLGSVTETVVRTAPCPVLTVRHHEPPRIYKGPITTSSSAES